MLVFMYARILGPGHREYGVAFRGASSSCLGELRMSLTQTWPFEIMSTGLINPMGHVQAQLNPMDHSILWPTITGDHS